jgi:molecular chaperone GrpE
MQRHKMRSRTRAANEPNTSENAGQPADDSADFNGVDALDPWANLEETLATPLTGEEQPPLSGPDIFSPAQFAPPQSGDGEDTPEQTPEERFKAELEDMRLRAAAEMENFKRRLGREHQEQMRYAAERVLGDLLPTLDNLDLALQYGTAHEACRDMLQGVAMTRKLLLEAVEKHGLVPMGEEGEEFTPEFHEAVGFDSRSDLKPGTVARVLQKGYRLGERLLRPAKVLINQTCP